MTTTTTVGSLLAQGNPSSLALISSTRNISLSYAQLSTHVANFASSVTSELDLKHGETVALALPNGLELSVAFLGFGVYGGVVAPLNPVYTQSEFEVCSTNLQMHNITLDILASLFDANYF